MRKLIGFVFLSLALQACGLADIRDIDVRTPAGTKKIDRVSILGASVTKVKINSEEAYERCLAIHGQYVKQAIDRFDQLGLDPSWAMAYAGYGYAGAGPDLLTPDDDHCRLVTSGNQFNGLGYTSGAGPITGGEPAYPITGYAGIVNP